jgi:integrase
MFTAIPYATRAIENGMGISALAKIVGHTDLSFTAKRYVHPEFEFIKKEMEASENRRGARRNSRQETVQILRV